MFSPGRRQVGQNLAKTWRFCRQVSLETWRKTWRRLEKFHSRPGETCPNLATKIARSIARYGENLAKTWRKPGHTRHGENLATTWRNLAKPGENLAKNLAIG